jgi:hypothetical protein
VTFRHEDHSTCLAGSRPGPRPHHRPSRSSRAIHRPDSRAERAVSVPASVAPRSGTWGLLQRSGRHLSDLPRSLLRQEDTAPGIVSQPRLAKLSPDHGHSRHRTKDPAPRRTCRARRGGYQRDLALIHSNPADGGQGPSHCEGNKLATSSTVMIFPSVGEEQLAQPSLGRQGALDLRASFTAGLGVAVAANRGVLLKPIGQQVVEPDGSVVIEQLILSRAAWAAPPLTVVAGPSKLPWTRALAARLLSTRSARAAG